MKLKQWIFIVSVGVIVVIIGVIKIYHLYSSTTVIETPVTETDSQEQPSFGNDVFVSAISSDRFDDLTLEDFPSTLSDGYAQSAAVYKDHIFIASINHILEYDQQGALVRYSDQHILNCAGELPGVIAVAGDSLYMACWNVGIFEIDLLQNRTVYLFDTANGLTNTQNLRLFVDDQTLWVATFSGMFRIDRSSRTVKKYSNIFGSACPDENVSAFVSNNDVWATSLAGCGAAEYQPTDDRWTVYPPTVFNQNDVSRVDFNDFIVSSAGVFATHQDGGPDHIVLSQFDPITTIWNYVTEETGETFPKIIAEFLPAMDTYTSSYATTNNNLTVWHLKTDDNWMTLALPDRHYLAMTPLMDDRYFLLSSLGMEQYVKDQAFPELLTTHIAGNSGARILVSSKGNFVLGISDQINDYGGDWVQSTMTIYNRETKQAFTSIIPGTIDGEIPLIGFLKDPSAFTFTEQETTLSITENGKDILIIDPQKEQITFSGN